MPQEPTPIHPACLDPETLLKQCKVDRLRGKGGSAGGQRKNKVETAVRITHEPTGVIGQAGERRDQSVNHKVAVFRLRVELALRERGWFALESMPSERWRARVHDGKLAINERHSDFPALLAEALDALALKRWEPSRAGVLLGVSGTQIVKLLKKEPSAFVLVNFKRRDAGRPMLL